MVDFGRRKDFMYTDSSFGTHSDYNRSKISVERYKSCRSPRTDNFRYSVSCRMNRSRPYDSYLYSDRSRSRESFRLKYEYYDDGDKVNSNSRELIHSDVKEIQDGENSYPRKRYLLECPLPSISYMHNSSIDLSRLSTSRNFKFPSSNEVDIGLFAHEELHEPNLYMKQNTYLGDDNITNKENMEDKMTLMKNNSQNKIKRVNSLLGDGPEHLRIYPTKFKKKYTLCVDKLLIKNFNINEPEKIGINNERTLNTPISPNTVNNSLSISEYTESKIAVFDYNHQDANIINLIKPTLDLTFREKECFEFSRDFNKDVQIMSVDKSYNYVNEHKSQIKLTSNLLGKKSLVETMSDMPANTKWLLMPLDTPLRVSISADNINLSKCSKKDPRIKHIIKYKTI